MILITLGRKLQDVEPDDTCLRTKVKAQNQFGSDFTLFHTRECEIKYYFE